MKLSSIPFCRAISFEMDEERRKPSNFLHSYTLAVKVARRLCHRARVASIIPLYCLAFVVDEDALYHAFITVNLFSWWASFIRGEHAQYVCVCELFLACHTHTHTRTNSESKKIFGEHKRTIHDERRKLSGRKKRRSEKSSNSFRADIIPFMRLTD